MGKITKPWETYEWRKKIKNYLYYLTNTKQCSSSYLSQAICSLKLYYSKIKGVPVKEIYIPFPKKEKLIPNVLSKNEIQRILEKTENIKHKAMLMLAYSAGLRLGVFIA